LNRHDLSPTVARVSSSSSPSDDKWQDLLRGYPESTVAACAEFKRSGSPEAFDQALSGIIEHHLIKPPPQPVASLPGTTTLVAELGLDSLTMVEMAFLFEDLFATKVPHEDYVKVQTLDDLRTLLRARIASSPSS
jgi:acyl carrier protein